MRVTYIVFGVAVVFLSGLFAFLGGQFGAKSVRQRTQAPTSRMAKLEEEVAALRRQMSVLESELKGLRDSIEYRVAEGVKVSRSEEASRRRGRKELGGARSEAPAGGGEGFTKDELKEMMRQMVEEMQKKKGKKSFEEEKAEVLRRLMRARDKLLAGGDEGFHKAMEASGIGEMESEEVRRILVDWLSMVIQLVESVQQEMSEEEVERMREDMEEKLKSMVEQVLTPEQIETLKKQFPKGVLAEIVKK